MNKISIIIPCYNVEKYIKQCLDSVINQTYTNLEIICVNDGSTDDTLAILKEYEKKDSRIILINQINRGLSDTRNVGMSIASGKYLVFIDGDDYVELNTCELAIDAISQNECDLVIWNYVKEFPGVSHNKMIFSENKINFNKDECKNILRRRIFGLSGDELAHPENADTLVTAWGKMYKKDLILDNKIEFVDTKIIGTEDALFNAMVFKYIESAVYIPDCLNHYRKDNPNSITTKYKGKLYEQWLTLFNYMEEILINENLDDSFIISLNNRIALSLIGLGLNELSNSRGSIEQMVNIKKILNSDLYSRAYKELEFQYFQAHWKIFFFCAKKKMSIVIWIMLKAINYLKNKI